MGRHVEAWFTHRADLHMGDDSGFRAVRTTDALQAAVS